MTMPVRIHAIALAVLTAMALLPGPAAAQVPDQVPEELQQLITAQGLQGRLLQQIQQSGITPDQIRQRLAGMGYDPSILDPYLSMDGTPPPEPTAETLTAAQATGLLAPRTPGDSLQAPWLELDALPDSSALEKDRGLRVFGLETFGRATDRFRPVTGGPVPPGHRIGPGDELVLILTGDVEQSYRLPVTREGFIVVPQVGQIPVNGLTMGELREQMYTHLGRSYSGIGRGPEATTHFQLTLSQVRPNQVFLAGQVVRPGAYLPSAVAPALNALYLGGGPLPTGSFRDVRVMRDGQLAMRLDLYEYLIEGDNLAGAQLQPGDVVFVPTAHAQVSIEGEIARPAIYEVLDGETVVDLIRFAGGLNAPAQLRRARIERILPPVERTAPGVDRVVIDVDLAEAMADPGAAPRLEPGDAVRIFPVRPELRRTVSIHGAVWSETRRRQRDTLADTLADTMATRAALDDSVRAARRGARDTAGDSARQAAADSVADVLRESSSTFRWYDGMRLWDLIERAGGLRDDAYRGRAQIVRVDPRDSSLVMIPTTLERTADGEPVANPALREFDTVRVFRKSDFTTDFPVTIVGDVRTPMNTVYEEGMTLRDLVLRGGGLNPTADLTIEVARLPDPSLRGGDTIARIHEVRVDSSFLVSDQVRQYYLGEIAEDAGPAAEFLLRPYDRVTVRELPDLELQRSVQVHGQVRRPGFYTLEHKAEPLSSILRRAGGLKSEAYAGGARFFREGVRVNIDLAAAIRRPGGDDDLVMLQGDSLFVPEYNPVVLVRGAVNGDAPVAIQFREGAGLEYYINNAGGYARNADEDRIHIRYANGEGAAMGRFLMFARAPEPAAGATITVPAREESPIDTAVLLGNLAQIATTITTLLLVITRF